MKIKAIKIKKQTYLMQNLDSGHIMEVKAVSQDAAKAQMGDRWIIVG